MSFHITKKVLDNYPRTMEDGNTTGHCSMLGSSLSPWITGVATNVTSVARANPAFRTRP